MALVPVPEGCAVMLIDGRELARFTGPHAKRKALRFVAVNNPPLHHRRRILDSDIGRSVNRPSL